MRDRTITLSHGSGGKAMRDLIKDVFISAFDNPLLAPLEDQARVDLSNFAPGSQLAITTDSYVITPLFFPNHNIGELAVNGTVNDLAVSGATPLYLTSSFIIEEGLAIATLREIALSMRRAADIAGVKIVTGDTKVVNRGCADQLFINTTGVGVIPPHLHISASNLQIGDAVIINGEIGNHGAAILLARGELALAGNIVSDCQALNSLVTKITHVCPEIHAMRDATRGGLATVLNEFAQTSQVGIEINESAIPVTPEVRGVCEILGLEPLYLANEGKLVVIVANQHAEKVLAAMRSHPAGQNACIIGHVIDKLVGRVVMKTSFGSTRIVDMLIGDQLPRIC